MTHRLTSLTAALIAVPIAAVMWFEAAYLYFGATAVDPPQQVKWMIAVAAYAMVMSYTTYGARSSAEVVLRACRLGITVSIALPIVTLAVLLIWVYARVRPDLGMGGLALYSIPIVALVVAIVLVIAFGTGRWLARRRLQAVNTRN
ncbi:MAG TPA: hypothetical protein VJ691_05490 [Vicinamibacterales bacterium]|nr:hypothetical protein [Vicinamibacterales bacterium]